MSVSIEQAAANLAAALESGNSQDAASALASYADAIDGVEDVPEADNGPIKRDLAEAEGAEAEGAEAEGAEAEGAEAELVVEPVIAEVSNAPGEGDNS